jgi:PLP dependent protein
VSEIAQNLQRIRERIAGAALACGRSPLEITLLAISKTFPIEAVTQAIEAGQHHFGENRVQEAEAKIPAFRADSRLSWHLVGHLQSNKVRRAAELFDTIHSLDSIKLAMKLSEAGLARGRPISVLLEVKLGEEETKSGTARREVRDIVSAARGLPGLRLNGLMTIPPFFDDPEQTRPFFAELRQLKDTLEREHPGCLGEQHLSMGMSHDFEVAICEGATILRIGTAIFGERRHD